MMRRLEQKLLRGYEFIANALYYWQRGHRQSGDQAGARHDPVQRDALLEILKAIQDGQEMTPEFCRHIDAAIEEIETTKLNQQEIAQ